MHHASGIECESAQYSPPASKIMDTNATYPPLVLGCALTMRSEHLCSIGAKPLLQTRVFDLPNLEKSVAADYRSTESEENISSYA
jgi:hypothetical protein